MDGIDNSEILLIDSLGCPTDVSIMGSLTKAGNSGKTLLAPFEAFKFPTSDIVQFKALVTPCLPNCEPVDCSVKSHGQTRDFSSMGKRRRRGTSPYGNGARMADKDDVVVVQTIQITDKFGFEKQDKLSQKRGRDDITGEFQDVAAVSSY
ncbi:ZP domain-containing protein [Trichonephila clavipes]|uniref:ZP domain-containing protein n=1 Tax=Trichonephila clavipes TaxID=2585209 RepID=A0A8X6V8X1_TRICX|nr:ZP domain-containing protein [Trichonephila clavipes]